MNILPHKTNPISLISEQKESLRYQRGNHNPYIDEEQTTQWPKESVIFWN